ncbi:hypothetical protein ACFYOY_26250 [Streptomyces sp. NPDC007875]|uniref:hypothetical protein n=1 Tax=Streptomyces sp. NPDC007875 TaxID=3364783 RepID=UPI0036AE3A3A
MGTAETDRQLTDSTRLMYSADMAAFTAWCASVGRRPLPAPQLRLCHPGRGEPGALRVHRRLRQQPARIQKRLGYLSPIAFEEQYYADRAMAEQANLSIHQPALNS